ncbi:hypothetical protein PENCOP_c011G08240 [Penicillium coprophilum]|uniref:Alcohol dehydrogenase-like C-terminal domain-containing protein n=1 Tax=Penicillium coprophilum TaxID=36646 RepID=A0A1V6UE38_9EURO|nr:hypothetical protein PENCOP_c011G08240 [Penicillium coprophilum]
MSQTVIRIEGKLLVLWSRMVKASANLLWAIMWWEHSIQPTSSTSIHTWLNGQGGPVDCFLRGYYSLPASAAVEVPKKSAQSFSEWSTLVWTGGVAITRLILAKAADTTTIVTSSTGEKLELFQSKFGPDYGINYKKHLERSREVMRLTRGEGMDFVFENGGPGTILESTNSIKIGGNVSVIDSLSRADQFEVPDVAGMALAKGATIRSPLFGIPLLVPLSSFKISDLSLAKDCVHLLRRRFFTQEDVVKIYEYVLSKSRTGDVCIKVAE